MRFRPLVPAALILAATTIGCAQVAGIQDISGSMADQHCVDTVNMWRTSAGLPTFTRWLEEEQCADEAGTIQASGGTFPSCLADFAWDSDGSSGLVDPDSMIQQMLTAIWSSGGHGSLGTSTATKLACGYGTSPQYSGAALIYGP